MAGDDITNAELARRLDAFSRDMHSDLKDIQLRLDQYVLQAVYRAEQAARDAQFSSLDERVKDGERQRRALVRYLVGAVVMPAAAMVMTIVINLKGPH